MSIKKKNVDAKTKAKELDAAIERLEQNMNLLGISGVEDLLQEDIKRNLEMIRNAQIKVWMLTGDKAETAEIIGISSGIKDEGAATFKMVRMTEEKEINRKLNKLGRYLYDDKILVKPILIIDGSTLSEIFGPDEESTAENPTKNLFFEVTT